MKKPLLRPARAALVAAILLAGTFATTAQAADDGNWVLRFGVHTVVPKSDNGSLAGMQATINNSTRPSASLEYMFTPNWGVDVLAAWPFSHDVRLNGVEAATTRQLPPTIGINYHFLPNARVSPFVGAGVNFTWFYDAKGVGPLTGTKVSVANSWGGAVHAGLDVKLANNWLLTADARWINIESDVRVNGVKVGTAKVNPMVYGLSLGYRF